MARFNNMNAGRIYIDTGKSLYCCVYNSEKDIIKGIFLLNIAIYFDSDICFIGSEQECKEYVFNPNLREVAK